MGKYSFEYNNEDIMKPLNFKFMRIKLFSRVCLIKKLSGMQT